MSVEYAMVGHNSSIFASELCEYGSLFDICNHHKLTTCRNLDEVIAMIFAEQMLSILDHLHASNIIHGDIKPDNFLLMKKYAYFQLFFLKVLSLLSFISNCKISFSNLDYLMVTLISL